MALGAVRPSTSRRLMPPAAHSRSDRTCSCKGSGANSRNDCRLESADISAMPPLSEGVDRFQRPRSPHDSLEVAGEHVGRAAAIQSCVRSRKPRRNPPSRPQWRQFRADPLSAHLQGQIVRVELEHRYPEAGAPLEAEDLACADECGEADRVAALVLFQQTAHDLTGCRATRWPECLKQGDEASCIGEVEIHTQLAAGCRREVPDLGVNHRAPL